MARRHRRLARARGGGARLAPLAPVSAAAVLVCLLLACGCCCLAATKPAPAAARTASVETPGGMRMNVKYSPEEVDRWMDRMANSPDSPFRPATDEDNAFFNRMAASSSNAKKTTAPARGGGGGSRSSSGAAAAAAAGFDGHIEFSDQYPFARIVVDGFHSAGDSSSSSSSHAEYYDVKDL
ncbi:hypothetical protein U9M48_034755 [Paspalum notatum var. saurae]|uniref:Uncharacterized protein n=1 Tax=Paspalum notatum var. saurae TaxID=547442 RepID=A0AAQ3X7P2_PASNO